MKKQIRLGLEALDLSDVDSKLLVVKLGPEASSDDLLALQNVFYEVLKDMDKKLRVAFVPAGTSICLSCPKAEEILKLASAEEEKGERIEGKS